MKVFRLFTCVVVLMVSVLFARADEASHRQAAEELLQVMNIEKQMETAMNQMLDIQMRTQPTIAPYRDVLRKFLSKHLSFAALKDDLVQIYMDEFTESELRQISAFYKTSAGKKIIEKGPILIQKGMQLGVQRVAKHQGELKQMIEEAKKQKKKE